MPYFIRSGSLTSFPEVARQGRARPGELMREFGLPRGCLAEPDLMVPDRTGRPTARSRGRAQRTRGVRPADGRGAQGLEPRPAGHVRTRAADAARRRRSRWPTTPACSTKSLTVSARGRRRSRDPARRDCWSARRCRCARPRTRRGRGCSQMIRSFLGPDWRPRRVCFVHEAPRDTAVHARVFGRDVHFGQDFNGIVCARRDLTVANPHADPTMARYARQLLEIRKPTEHGRFDVAGAPAGRHAAGLRPMHRRARRADVARRPPHDPSSTAPGRPDLQRDRRFRAPRTWPRYLADRRRSVAQMSALLGFAAPSGFSRWYRQQFGQPASRRARCDARRNPTDT